VRNGRLRWRERFAFNLYTAAPRAPNRRRVVVSRSSPMDGSRFDAWSRALVTGHSRRGLTRLLGGLTLGSLVSRVDFAEIGAKKKKHKKHKRHAISPPVSPPPSP